MTLVLLSLPVLVAGALSTLALRSNRAAAIVAVSCQFIASALVLYGVAPLLAGSDALELRWDWPQPIGVITFRLDALSAFFLAWSLPMTLLATVYATGYLQRWLSAGRHGGPHYALLNLVSASFVLIYTSQNALVFLLGWEIAAVSAWLLVIWDYRNQKIRFAGFNYLVSTHVGLFILVAAFMLLHSLTGSMDFARFGEFLSRPTATRATVFLLLGASFALKSAFFPFHTWLPRAHSAAPAHISALMSGVIHKAGLFAFLRFSLLMGEPEEWMGWSVLGFGTLSAIFGVLYTTTQRDLKRMLGYSSTENVGIAAIGFGLGYLGWSWHVPSLVLAGFAGGLLHLLNHAVFKCLLFYAAGAVYRATHTVDIERLGGLANRMPRTAAVFLVGGVAMSALPPLNGFVGEFVLYSGLLSGAAPKPTDNTALAACAAALAFVGAVSALSMTRAFGITFLGNPRDSGLRAGEDPPRTMWVPMVIHAVGIVALGLAPELGIGLIRSTLASFAVEADLDHTLAAMQNAAWANRALAAVLCTAGAARWLQGLRTRRTTTWGCGYNALTPRMQYTGSSFSDQFAQIFEAFMPRLRRQQLPSSSFPQSASRVATHHPDAVEQKMFEVLGRGEQIVVQSAHKLSERPRWAFVAGLIALLAIGAFVVGAGGSR